MLKVRNFTATFNKLKPHPPSNVNRPGSIGHLNEVLEDVAALDLNGVFNEKIADPVQANVLEEAGQGGNEELEAVKGELRITFVEFVDALRSESNACGGKAEELGHVSVV